MRESAVCTCVCVPTTADARPSRCHPIAIFSLVASAWKSTNTSGEIAFASSSSSSAEENTHPETFGNARGVRNLYERILVQQANRLAGMETVTREDLMRLTKEDVAAAREAD